MRLFNLSLPMTLLALAACSKLTTPRTVHQRLSEGSRLYWAPGECGREPASVVDKNGYFAVEKGGFVVVNGGSCRTKLMFAAKWLREDRVLLSQPKALESCPGFKLNVDAQMVFQFDAAATGVRFQSSHQRECRWLRWG